MSISFAAVKRIRYLIVLCPDLEGCERRVISLPRCMDTVCLDIHRKVPWFSEVLLIPNCLAE